MDERTLGLGKTLRILQPRLPTLLSTANPLPNDILSPTITLHLFPSTHPHLPTVSGRVPYLAALWTAPVAWGRVPLVGNVGLEVLSERMVQGGHHLSSLGAGEQGIGHGDEKLVVRWRTKGKEKRKKTKMQTATIVQDDDAGPLFRRGNSSKSSSSSSTITSTDADPADGSDSFPSSSLEDDDDDDDSFTGLFIFTFDGHGRIQSHIIEHVEEDSGASSSSRDQHNHINHNGFLSLTEWLLRRLGRGTRDLPPEGLAWGCCTRNGSSAA